MNDQSLLFDLPGPRALRRERIGNVVGVVVLAALTVWIVAALAAIPPGPAPGGEELRTDVSRGALSCA